MGNQPLTAQLMTLINILEVLGTLIVALGGFEGIKYLINKRSEKKKAAAEANKAEADAEQAEHLANDAKYAGVIQGYESLLQQDATHIEYYKHLVKDEVEQITVLQKEHTDKLREFQEIVEAKNNKIQELMEQINDLTSQVTALSLMKCHKLDCNLRQPPILDNSYEVRNGLLKEMQE